MKKLIHIAAVLPILTFGAESNVVNSSSNSSLGSSEYRLPESTLSALAITASLLVLSFSPVPLALLAG